jgi:hypothetical protein
MCPHKCPRSPHEHKINHQPSQEHLRQLKMMSNLKKMRNKFKIKSSSRWLHISRGIWRRRSREGGWVGDLGNKGTTPKSPSSNSKRPPINMILGDIQKGVTTCSWITIFYVNYSFVSSFEPFRVEDTLKDPDWMTAMQEELNNFKINEVWCLVSRPNQNVV